MKYSSNMLMRLVTAFALLAALSSCNQGEILSDGQLAVESPLRIERTSGGGYLLAWDHAGGIYSNVEYQIYFQDLGSGVDPNLWKDAAHLRGGRPYTTILPTSVIDPQSFGRVIKDVSNGTFYEIDIVLTSTHSYAFKIVAKDNRKQESSAAQILVLGPVNPNYVDPASGETSAYIGCVSGHQTSPNAAEIRLGAIDGAKDIILFRDDTEIGRTGPEGGTIRDSEIKAGAKHTYTCQAAMRGEIWVGSQNVVISFDNPFAGWKGCRSYATLSDSIEVEFDFPSGAQKVEVLRDGKKVFETTSSARTKFIDKEIIAGETYQYECTASLDKVFELGEKKLTVTVPDLLSSYPGCSAARALGTSEVLVEFTFPTGVSGVDIFRNGIKIFSTTKRNITTFLDSSTDLVEAQSYRYSCGVYAGRNSRIGPNEITVTTLTSNPPSFAGITEAEMVGPTSARIRWGVDNGAVPAAYFQVYASMGHNVDYTAEPVARISAGTLIHVVDGLGDELPYSFGVRACSIQDICDTNTVKRSLTMLDNGAPKTPGAVSANVVNGKIVVTAPWQHQHGAISKRYVYLKHTGAGSLDLADYTDRAPVVFNVNGDNLLAPPTQLEISGLMEHTTYHIVVVDHDPSGKYKSPSQFATVTTTDLTPPAFSGVTSLSSGTPANTADTSLTAVFPELAPELAIGDGGASAYIIYILQGGGNACRDGTKHEELSVGNSNGSGSVSHVIRGLAPATLYSVCVKAKDQTGNISANIDSLSRKTLALRHRSLTASSLSSLTKTLAQSISVGTLRRVTTSWTTAFVFGKTTQRFIPTLSNCTRSLLRVLR